MYHSALSGRLHLFLAALKASACIRLAILRLPAKINSCFRTFEFKEKSLVNTTWKRDWSAAFYLDVKTSSFIRKEEFLVYDIWDLTSGLGGLLGLFVGTSFLGIIFVAVESAEKILYFVKYQQKIMFK